MLIDRQLTRIKLIKFLVGTCLDHITIRDEMAFL